MYTYFFINCLSWWRRRRL